MAICFLRKRHQGRSGSQGRVHPAHIRENNRSSRSTLVSPTRLADRASMQGSITLDVVRLLLTTNCSIKRHKKNWQICLGSLFACLWGGSTSRRFCPAPLQGVHPKREVLPSPLSVYHACQEQSFTMSNRGSRSITSDNTLP